MSPILRYLLSGSRTTAGDKVTDRDVESRLAAIELRVNVLIGLAIVNLMIPLAGLVWSSVKWLLILGPIIVLCLGLALFRHRLPEAGRRAWEAISTRRTVSEESDNTTANPARTAG